MAGRDLEQVGRDREIVEVDGERWRGGRHDRERGDERRLGPGDAVIGYVKIPGLAKIH